MLAAFQNYPFRYAVGLKQVFLLVKKLTGGPKEARTLNFQLAKLALSLLSYRPIMRLSVVYTGTVNCKSTCYKILDDGIQSPTFRDLFSRVLVHHYVQFNEGFSCPQRYLNCYPVTLGF